MVMKIVVANILEWDQQGKRRGLAGSVFPGGDLRFPPDDMALFWGGSDRLVLNASSYPREFVESSVEIMGYSNMEVITLPAGDSSDSISDRAIEFFSQVEERIDIEDAPKAKIDYWGTTPNLVSFTRFVAMRRPELLADEWLHPRQIAVTEYLDSKSGSRDAVLMANPQSYGIEVPRAFSIGKDMNIYGLLEGAIQTLGSLVVKSNYGSGGHGIVTLQNIEALQANLELIQSLYSRDGVLVEEYLSNVGNTIPIAYNGIVSATGDVHTRSIGRQVIGQDKAFRGSQIGLDSLPLLLREPVDRLGLGLGQVLYSMGFYGHFNLDCIFRSSDSTLFAGEINPRRSGSSTLVDMAEQIYGCEFERRVSALALERVPVATSIRSYSDLRQRLESVSLYGRLGNEAAVIPYIVSSLDDSSAVGIATFGRDATESHGLMDSVTELLRR